MRYLIEVCPCAILHLSPGEITPIYLLPFEVSELGLGVNCNAIQVIGSSHNDDIVVEIILSLQGLRSTKMICGQYGNQEGIIKV